MKINIDFQGEEIYGIELPDNTKSVTFNIDRNGDSMLVVVPEKASFFEPCECNSLPVYVPKA